jgi:hypothetical protein
VRTRGPAVEGLGEIWECLACPVGKWPVHPCLPGRRVVLAVALPVEEGACLCFPEGIGVRFGRGLAGLARESSLRISHRKTDRRLPGRGISPAWPTWGPGGYVRESRKPNSGCAAASLACWRRSARESSLRISHGKTKEQLPSTTISPVWPTYGPGGYVRESRAPKSGGVDPPLAFSLACSRTSARESSLRISHRKTNGQLPSTKDSPAWLTFGLGGYVRERVESAQPRRAPSPRLLADFCS